MGKAARQANRLQRRARYEAARAVPKVVHRRDFGDEPGMEALEVVATDAFVELVRLRQRLLEDERLVTFWVAQARSAGVTWQRIGEALDVSQQAASKRFGRRPVSGGVRSYGGL